MMPTLAVFGGSGRTGQLLVDAALAGGWGVNVLVRPGANFPPRPRASVLRGSLDDLATVTPVVRGVNAVCCVFGPRSTADAPFRAAGTKQVIAAMHETGARRLVCVTGAMLGDLAPNVGLAMRALATLFRRTAPVHALDGRAQERLISESGMDWTIVKPPRLTDGGETQRVCSGPELPVGLLSRISRRDLACFLLQMAETPRYLRTRVYVKSG